MRASALSFPPMSSAVPVEALIGWMLLLTFKHIIADFVLQTAWMAHGKDQKHGWAAYLRDKDVPPILAAYNERMAKVCREEEVAFAAEVLAVSFGPEDFLDSGHLTAKGSAKLASALAPRFSR